MHWVLFFILVGAFCFRANLPIFTFSIDISVPGALKQLLEVFRILRINLLISMMIHVLF